MPKITALTALSRANLAPTVDVLVIVDISANETKKIVVADMVNGALPLALTITAAVDTTLRQVQDNAAAPVASQLYLATNKSAFAGSLSVGKTTAPGAIVDIAGAGATTGTSSLRVTNSGGAVLFDVNDAQYIWLGANSGVNNAVVEHTTSSIFVSNLRGRNYLNYLKLDDSSNRMAFVCDNTQTVQFGLTESIFSNTGSFALNASSLVSVNSTSKGFLPPRMTTAQKNAIGTPVAGLLVFDTDLAKLCVYSGAAWQTITSV